MVTKFLKGVFAKNATQITTPNASSPVSGEAYRNINLTKAEMERGAKFNNPWNSSEINQALFDMSTAIEDTEKQGIASWKEDITYSQNDIVRGSDGYLYIAGINVDINLDPTIQGDALIWQKYHNLPKINSSISSLNDSDKILIKQNSLDDNDNNKYSFIDLDDFKTSTIPAKASSTEVRSFSNVSKYVNPLNLKYINLLPRAAFAIKWDALTATFDLLFSYNISSISLPVSGEPSSRVEFVDVNFSSSAGFTNSEYFVSGCASEDITSNALFIMSIIRGVRGQRSGGITNTQCRLSVYGAGSIGFGNDIYLDAVFFQKR